MRKRLRKKLARGTRKQECRRLAEALVVAEHAAWVAEDGERRSRGVARQAYSAVSRLREAVRADWRPEIGSGRVVQVSLRVAVEAFRSSEELGKLLDLTLEKLRRDLERGVRASRLSGEVDLGDVVGIVDRCERAGSFDGAMEGTEVVRVMRL